MSSEKEQEFIGPIEELEWPEKLTAHVVTPGPCPQIHGYNVEADLARHYSFTELTFLALTGNLPNKEVGRGFDIVLKFIAPSSIAEAPAHSAVLARLTGARPSAVLGVAALTLAEQIDFILRDYEEILVFFQHQNIRLPECLTASNEDERQTVRLLRSSLGFMKTVVPILESDPSKVVAILAVLYALGLRKKEQVSAVFLVSRLPCVVAEAFAVQTGAFKDYPMNLPPFHYVETPQ